MVWQNVIFIKLPSQSVRALSDIVSNLFSCDIAYQLIPPDIHYHLLSKHLFHLVNFLSNQQQNWYCQSTFLMLNVPANGWWFGDRQNISTEARSFKIGQLIFHEELRISSAKHFCEIEFSKTGGPHLVHHDMWNVEVNVRSQQKWEVRRMKRKEVESRSLPNWLRFLSLSMPQMSLLSCKSAVTVIHFALREPQTWYVGGRNTERPFSSHPPANAIRVDQSSSG